MQRISDKNGISEILWITATCLTTKWIYLPIGIALYVSFGMWLFISIHPLALFIAPTLVAVYALWLEDKRFKALYGLTENKADSHLQPLFTTHDLRLQKLVNEYIELLEKQDKNKEEG